MIPWRLFHLLMDARTGAQAEEQLLNLQAITMGSAAGFGGDKKGRLKREHRRLARQAYPEVEHGT